MQYVLYASLEEAESHLDDHESGTFIAVGYPKAHGLYRLNVSVNRKTQEESRTLSWLFNQVGQS